ncbi:MAG: hypothetical protein AB1816_17130, partial [Bacillota bacterium]
MWKAYLGELAPEAMRGAVYGAFNAVVGFAALPASLLAGVLWDRVGHGAPFLFGGGWRCWRPCWSELEGLPAVPRRVDLARLRTNLLTFFYMSCTFDSWTSMG